MAMLVRPEHF
jgi:hypothetical protein